MATVAVELRPGPFRSSSDQADVKALLGEITESDIKLKYYVIAAQLVITGRPEEMPRSATPRVQR